MGLVILFDQEILGQKKGGFWGLNLKIYMTSECSRTQGKILISPAVTDKMTRASYANKTPAVGFYPEII
jgi:hypothetical protein